MLALSVVIDTSLDTSGFFANNPQALPTLQTAANELASRFNESLPAITPGGGNTWSGRIENPSTGAIQDQANLVVPQDTLIVFAGARNFANNTLAVGRPGGLGANTSFVDQTFFNALVARNNTGAGAPNQERWGGSIAFNTTTNWHFNTQTAPPNNTFDFYSNAKHELAHMLGFGTITNWANLTNGLTFTGPLAIATHDAGGPVPLADASHYTDATTDNGEPVAMGPTLFPGTRETFTELDYAGLFDLAGWSAKSVPTVSLSANSMALTEGGMVTLTATLSAQSTENVVATLEFASNFNSTALETAVVQFANTLTAAERASFIQQNFATFSNTLQTNGNNAAIAASAAIQALLPANVSLQTVVDTLNATQRTNLVNPTVPVENTFNSLSAQQQAAMGLATFGTDYTVSAPSITIPAGSTTGTTTVALTIDGVAELSETFNVRIVGVTNAVENGVQQKTITINDLIPIDFGDAPDTGAGTSNGNYNTLLGDNGARHVIGGPRLGALVDSEGDGLQDATATGDDNSNSDDEDGVTFGNFVTGQNTLLSANVQNANGRIDAWIDFNQDGDFLDAGERVVANQAANAGTTQQFQVAVPAGATLGTTFARVRVSTAGGLSPTGQAADGEVEDYQVTIFNGPPVTLSLNNATIGENGGVATVTANLGFASGQPVTVNLGLTGTATNGTDFNPSTNQIVIAPGQLSGTMTITAVNDAIDEQNETVIVDVTSVVNGGESGVQQVTTTIQDDDGPPTVNLSIDNANIAENGGVATATATLSNTTTFAVTVNLGYSGAATNGADYNAPAQIVIPAGQLTGTANITATQDTIDETNENVVVDITSVTNATENGTQQATTTIIDDDNANVSLSIDTSSIAENGGVATVTATLSTTSSQPVTVNLGYTGTATNGSDYNSSAQIQIPAGSLTGTAQITAINDTTDETNETVVVDITGVTNAAENGTQQVSTTIVDDDVVNVTLGVNPASISEAGGVAIVTATLSAASVQTVTVNLTTSGSATNGADYNLTGTQIVIAPGNTTGTVNIVAINDNLDEQNETATVDIASVVNGNESGTQSVTATIVDDDAPPTVTLSVNNTSIAEAGGTALVTATLSAVSTQNVTVTLSPSGSATLGTDYNVPTQIVIPAGSLTGTSQITSINDVIDEFNETVTVDITNVVNATENGTQQTTTTIVDDDAEPTVTLVVDRPSIAEAAGVAIVTAQLSSASGKPVTVNLSFAGQATQGVDYGPSTSQITIAAGATSGTSTITAIQDAIDEPGESIIVSINTVVNATEQGTQQVTTTIVDDDASLPDGFGVLGNAIFTLDLGANGLQNGEPRIQFGAAGDVPIVGDWDGDGDDDFGVRRTSNSTFFFDFNGDGILDKSIRFGISSDIPVFGDFDGNGKTDVGVFRPSTATFFLDTDCDGAVNHAVRFGASTDQPIVADIDGDGDDDIGVHRRSNSTFFFDTNLDGTPDFVKTFGGSGDIPVLGDWDGDGDDDVGVRRDSNQTFYLNTGQGTSIARMLQMGSSGDTPLVADFDGNGVDKLAVYQPGSSTFIRENGPTGLSTVPLGSVGDTPLVGAWSPSLVVDQGTVDLRGNLLGVNPAQSLDARWGQPLTISNAQIQNVGRNPSGPFNVQFFLSKDALGSTDDILLQQTNGSTVFSHRSVPGNGQSGPIFSVELQLPAQPFPGRDAFIIMKTDATNQVTETNENNNFGEVGFFRDSAFFRDPTALDVDLQAAWTTALAGQATDWGQPLTLDKVQIENLGASASGAFIVEWFLSRDQVGSADDVRLSLSNGSTSFSHPSIGPKSQGPTMPIELVLPAAMQGTDWFIITKTDAANQILETNENNNFGQRGMFLDQSFVRIPQAANVDLKGVALSVQPFQTSLGTNVLLDRVQIANTGAVASGQFNVRWVLSLDGAGSADDVVLAQTNGATTFRHDSIAGNSTGALFTVNLVLPPLATLPAAFANQNTFFVILQIDSSNEVSETNENNNFGQLGVFLDKDVIQV